MDEQKLNQKITEWVWPNAKPIEGFISVVQHPDGQLFCPKVDFTKSLDAFFKYIIPKLTYGYQLIGAENKHGADVNAFHESYHAEANTPTLALCLAIEKLIDVEN